MYWRYIGDMLCAKIRRILELCKKNCKKNGKRFLACVPAEYANIEDAAWATAPFTKRSPLPYPQG